MEQTTSSDFITTTEEVSGIEIGRKVDDDELDEYKDDDEDDDEVDESDSRSNRNRNDGTHSFNFPSLLQDIPSSTISASHHDHSYASTSTSTSTSKHLPHEALLRKIHLLELSLAEAQNLAGLKTRALEEQIVLLTGVVDAQKCEIREKDQEIIALKKGIIKDGGSYNPAESSGIPHHDQDKSTGLVKLNEELLAQNSALRNENTLLKGRVMMESSDGFGGLMAAGLEDESEAGEGFGHRRVPEDIRDAVGRILNPVPGMLPKLAGPRKRDGTSQTDALDIFDLSQQEIIVKLTREKEKIEQSYRIEKDINQELISSVQSLKQEINNLSTQFTTLSNDAEVALASERVALDQTDSLERSLEQTQKKLSDMQSAYTFLEKSYGKLEKEHEIVKATANLYQSEREREKERYTIDPLLFLETQWKKDRSEFHDKVQELQGALSVLVREKEALMQDLRVSRENGGGDGVEVIRLTGELSVVSDKLRRIEADVSVRDGRDVAVQAQLLKLETNLDAKTKQVKDLTTQVSLLKKEVARKTETISGQVTRINVLERERDQQDSKARLEASMLLSKEHLIRECRAKIKDLQILGGKVQVEQGSMDALQASLREAKVDSTRKTALLKKWKERALDLEKKVQEGEIKCRDSHISSKTHAQVSSALRASREKIEGLEGKVKSLRERDAQFCRVIGRFLTDSIALQEAPVGSIADSLLPSSSAAAADGGGDAFKGIDIGQVDLLAQKFSKELLQVEWSEISMNYHPSAMGIQEMDQRLRKLLQSDRFEGELYTLLSETLQSF